MNRHITLRMTLLTAVTALGTVLIVVGGEHRIEARQPLSSVPLQLHFASVVANFTQVHAA